jgi:hypothetical protein
MANNLAPFTAFEDSAHIWSESLQDFILTKYITVYDSHGHPYQMDKQVILDFLNFHSDDLVVVQKRKHEHLVWGA